MTVISASSTIQYVDDSVSTTDANSLTKVKEFIVTDSYTGSWRIVFDLLGDYDSEPAYAQIYKNGTAYGTLQYVNGFPPDYSYKTFSQDFTGISISSGDHIQIYAYILDPGYAASVQNFRIEYTLPSGSLGGAAFASNPTGARIWVDGVDKGVNTPDTIANLSTGSHSYTLKLAGYNDATGPFSVSTATTTIVPIVTMTAGTTGNASFSSIPTGATIWVDNSNTGLITPNTIANLSAGGHNYTLKLTGYADATGPFSVTSGSTTTVPTVTFAPSAYFITTPTGASIYIDTVAQGRTTPATITNLSVGSHTFKLILAGYNASSGNFSTIAGSTTNISQILSGTAMAFLTSGD